MIGRIAAALSALVFAFPALANIEIEEVTSPGGIEAWLVEDHSIPFVALEFWFVGGSALDAPEARGATYLMMGLLEEGAADMDAQAFAEAVEGLATSFDFDSSRDAVTVSARMLTQNRDEAADLLRAALVEPRSMRMRSSGCAGRFCRSSRAMPAIRATSRAIRSTPWPMATIPMAARRRAAAKAWRP